MELRSVIIFGAGEFGQLIHHLLINEGFVDDNKNLQNSLLFGKKILSRKIFAQEIKKNDLIIIAIRSRNDNNIQLQKIKKWLTEFKINFFFLPDFKFFLENGLRLKESLSKDYEVFLNRNSHTSSYPKQDDFYKNKTILITGATGSIGCQLLTHIEQFDVKKIIGIDKNEEGIFWLKMKTKKSELKLIDCKVYKNLQPIFEENEIDIVINAAAYKHVPLFEENLESCWENNLLIVENLSKLSHKYRVKNFLQVSSDKAVNPTNAMGASKRVAELYLQSYFKNKNINLTITRFGNVLGSSGSVIKIFEKQLEENKPITVTNPDITRYFMSIGEAVVLLSESIIYTKSEGLFVLNMGEPVKIIDLAKDFLISKNIRPIIGENITITGLREGEKMYEEILFPDELKTTSENDKIFIVENFDIENDFLKKYNDFKKSSVTKHNINKLIKEYYYE